MQRKLPGSAGIFYFRWTRETITNFPWRKCAIRHRSRLAERWEGKVLGNNAKSRKLLTNNREHVRAFPRKADEPFPRRFMCFCYSPIGLKSGALPSWKSFSRQCFWRWFEFVSTFPRLEIFDLSSLKTSGSFNRDSIFGWSSSHTSTFRSQNRGFQCLLTLAALFTDTKRFSIRTIIANGIKFAANRWQIEPLLRKMSH